MDMHKHICCGNFTDLTVTQGFPTWVVAKMRVVCLVRVCLAMSTRLHSSNTCKLFKEPWALCV